VIACITTCDRPQPLQRLLQGLPASAGAGPRIRYLVIDDSRRTDNRRRNQEIVAACAAEGRCAIRYLGIAEQQRFIEGLVDVLPQREAAIRFLLEAVPDGTLVSHGRTRNLALLFTVGKPLLFLDDDILPQSFAPPASAPRQRSPPVRGRRSSSPATTSGPATPRGRGWTRCVVTPSSSACASAKRCRR
jgi:hypothetical protein